MKWIVEFYDDFSEKFDVLSAIVQDVLLAKAGLLQEFGPSLTRPHVGTLKGSQHANMKELRFEADGGV